MPRGYSWSRRKKRVKSSKKIISKRESSRLSSIKYRKKKKALSNITNNHQMSVQHDVHYQITHPTQHNDNAHSSQHNISQNDNNLSVDSLTLAQQKIKELECENMRLRKERTLYKNKFIASDKMRYQSEMDIYHLTNQIANNDASKCEEYEKENEYKQMQPLTINMASNVSIINQNSFDPLFMKAFRDFTKIRLKSKCLKNSKALIDMIQCMNQYYKVMNNHNLQIELGGTSDCTLNNLMQYKAKQLFQMETCIVIKKKFKKNKSKITLYHDECSQRNESQLSVLLSFDSEPETCVPEQYRRENIYKYSPKMYFDEIILRAIWHQNIPSKESAAAVQWAVKPAIDELDALGVKLFESEWIGLREVMKTSLSVMSDQANGATKMCEVIGSEFSVRALFKLICGMHMMDNMILYLMNRLVEDRKQRDDQTLIEFKNMDILDMCNRIASVLNKKHDSIRNKGELYKVFTSRAEDKESFKEFVNVIGGRRQFLITNVEACVSQRRYIGKFGIMQDYKGKRLVNSPRLLMEFGQSVTLLIECIVVVCIKRTYIDAFVYCMGKTIGKMNVFVPAIYKSFGFMKKIIESKYFAVFTLFTVTALIDHSSVKADIYGNKLLTEEQVKALKQCTDSLQTYMNEKIIFDASGFLSNCIRILSECEDLSDRYFVELLSLNASDFIYCINQLQGAFINVRDDLKARFDEQASENIPNSAFVKNDCAESLNATGKYKGKYAPNIQNLTKAAHAVIDINKDGWYTFDYLIIAEFQLFCKCLKIWYLHCGSVKKAKEKKKKHIIKFKRSKWKKLRLIVNTASESIPNPKRRAAAQQTVIITEKAMINSIKWRNWNNKKMELLNEKRGQKKSAQRRVLKIELIKLMKYYAVHNNSWIDNDSLEGLQSYFYDWCKRDMQRRQS